MATERETVLETGGGDVAVREAVQRDRLLGLWAEIQPFAEPFSPEASVAVAPLTNAQRLMLSRWRTLFDSEIRLVRGARNEVVHSPSNLAGETLSGAVDVASQLREILFGGLQNPVVV